MIIRNIKAFMRQLKVAKAVQTEAPLFVFSARNSIFIGRGADGEAIWGQRQDGSVWMDGAVLMPREQYEALTLAVGGEKRANAIMQAAQPPAVREVPHE